MGTVQRLRYNILRRLSIDNDLNGFIRERLGEFNQESAAKRKAMLHAQASLAKSKHKIESSRTSGGKRKVVAVYDPETKRVIKQYSSLSAASSAAMYILNKLGYQSEMELSQSTVKQVVQKSRRDPSILLFGHRWLIMDCVRSGDFVAKDEGISAVSQSKSEIEVVKRCPVSNTISSTFSSIKEAFQDWLSTISSHISSQTQLAESNKSIELFEKKLMQDFVSFQGTTWSISSGRDSNPGKPCFQSNTNSPSASLLPKKGHAPTSKDSLISKSVVTEESSKVDERYDRYSVTKDKLVVTNNASNSNHTLKPNSAVIQESTMGDYTRSERDSLPTSFMNKGNVENERLSFTAPPAKVSDLSRNIVSTGLDTVTKGTGDTTTVDRK